MTQARWLLQTAENQPDAVDWLGPREAAVFAGIRFEKRRSEWLLGRWTAKRALAACLALEGHAPRPLSALEIIAAPDGAPEAYLDGRPAPFNLSISHRDGLAACVVCPAPTVPGCDLEHIEPRSDLFVADYFTPEEQTLVAAAADRDVAANLIWSAKECALKVLREGLRLDTRSVTVSFSETLATDGWAPVSVQYAAGGRTFDGWWQRRGDHLFTLVTAPAVAPPEGLRGV